MKTYKVIWFDDDYRQLGERIHERAHLNDIELVGFENAEDGIRELEKNIRSYDAAIVDGIFFATSKETGEATSDKPLFSVASAIAQLSSVKVLPWFILSGKSSFTKGQNRYADGFKDNVVYDKTSDEDLEKLWADIKVSADNHVETQIRHTFQKAFEVCTSDYIGVNASSHLLTILQRENQEKAFIDSDLYFTPLRKIVEDLFLAFHRLGFLPDIFVKPSVAINESSKFLSGIDAKGYQLDSPVFLRPVSENLRSILSICQPAAHRSEIDTFVAQVNSPYLLLSVTYQLLDVLLWFKSFADNNRDVAINKNRWNQIEVQESSKIIRGKVEQDKYNNYHCGNVLLTYSHIREQNYKVGDEIRVIKTQVNTNTKTSHLYEHCARQTEHDKMD